MNQGAEWGYWLSSRNFKIRYNHMLNGASKVRNILVIGAGRGMFERELRQCNPHINITSIEPNNEWRESLEYISDTVMIGDYLTIDIPGKYDMIVACDVIEHVLNTDGFLRKTWGLLADDGIAYIQTPNLASWHGRLSLLFGYLPEALEVSMINGEYGKPKRVYRPPCSVHHVRVFTYRALREMAQDYGFIIESARGIDYALPWLFFRFPSIAGGVCLKLRKDVA